jgi:hypothetical protein
MAASRKKVVSSKVTALLEVGHGTRGSIRGPVKEHVCIYNLPFGVICERCSTSKNPGPQRSPAVGGAPGRGPAVAFSSMPFSSLCIYGRSKAASGICKGIVRLLGV